MKVFISYRRDDSIVHARLIHNELSARFGAGDVFMDIDDIDYGADFARLIDEQLDAADVLVAVIGPRWSELLQRQMNHAFRLDLSLAESIDQHPAPGLCSAILRHPSAQWIRQ